MPDPLDAVNATIAMYAKWIEDAPAKGNGVLTVNTWKSRKRGLEDAVSEIQRSRAALRPVPEGYGDLSDLPPELLSQLSGIKTDELEDQLFAIIKAGGDEIELDRILIEMYRRHGAVHPRRFLNNKLYRMAQKSLIFIVAGRKGFYTLDKGRGRAATPDDDDDAAKARPRPRESFSDDLDDEIPF